MVESPLHPVRQDAPRQTRRLQVAHDLHLGRGFVGDQIPRIALAGLVQLASPVLAFQDAEGGSVELRRIVLVRESSVLGGLIDEQGKVWTVTRLSLGLLDEAEPEYAQRGLEELGLRLGLIQTIQ